MAAGKIIMQSADGASVGLTIPDGLTSGERTIALGANLSGVTAYHLLNGEVSVSNEVITSGFSTTLYTSGSATTGIDMDTQWGNDTSEKFGGLVWLKDRVEATNHFLYDTIRGATKEINSNTTEAEATLAGGLTGFTNTGFTVGADAGHNSTANNMVSWNFQTTHRRTGTTNHGKAYICHYNPFTGFTMVKYEGSGIAGHEIPHHLGRKLGFYATKNISAPSDWVISTEQYAMNFTTMAGVQTDHIFTDTTTIVPNGGSVYNGSGYTFIIYGWANSYFDESNKLIGNYEIGVYQGTGATGNKVTTKGKPAWLMVKRLDSTGVWIIFDNIRGMTVGNDNYLYSNASSAENVGGVADLIDVVSDGFVIKSSTGDVCASGGQYLYMAVYDNDNGLGKSKYPKATDSSQLQINTLVPFANGVDGNGAKNTILSKNETITGLTLTQGKNYVYCDKNGSYGVSLVAPKYNIVSTTGDYFDANKNKWFNSSGVEITESRNYLDAIVYADHNGQVEYVEQLPKTQYVDEMKANEFKGKNACTAWVNFDGTTTPPTIRDSYNVSAVIRTRTGYYRIYLSNMDSANYSWTATAHRTGDVNQFCGGNNDHLVSNFIVGVKSNSATSVDANLVSVHIYGGKN